MADRIEWNKKISKALTGIKRSDSYKQRRSDLMKEKWSDPSYREYILKSREGKMKPWNKGKKGLQTGWNKGMKIAYKARPNMKGKNAGEKNCNWKGGITRKHYGEDHIQRCMFRKEIQKLVFERDNYTCQMCGAHGVALQVDHIQPWAEYVELRFDMNNCRTLCQKCHYKITFGREMPDSVKTWGHNLKQVENIERGILN